MFEHYFRKLDENSKGYLERETFDEFVSVYRVPAADLERIWCVRNASDYSQILTSRFLYLGS